MLPSQGTRPSRTTSIGHHAPRDPCGGYDTDGLVLIGLFGFCICFGFRDSDFGFFLYEGAMI